MTATFDIAGYMAQLGQQVDAALAARLGELTASARHDPLELHAAMRQAVLAGGKRLRPCLLLSACRAVGGRLEQALGPACAVELVHAYSLVHDDLPAMDDDDTRRGQPTVHRRFGEATAILAGDALLTLAFETMAVEAEHQIDDRARVAALVRATAELARAAGTRGMIGGQTVDLEIKGSTPSFEELERCHSGKTAALFGAAAAIGALVGNGPVSSVERLRAFGVDLGLAFQHADDLRDHEFREHGARALARALELSRRARDSAAGFGDPAAPLVALTELVERRAAEAAGAAGICG